jgi:hypothetical protein
VAALARRGTRAQGEPYDLVLAGRRVLDDTRLVRAIERIANNVETRR